MKVIKCSPLISMFLSLSVAVVFCLISTPIFENGDDVGILAQVKGLYGFDTTYNTAYMSLPIGWFLVSLYKINNSFPWYSAILYVLLGLSLFVSINLFLLYIRPTPYKIACIIASVFLHWKIGSFVSFTAIALVSFISAAGILLYCLIKEEEPRYLMIISSILCCLSYAIRPSIVPIGIFLALPLLLFYIKRIVPKIKLVFIVCIPLFAVICVDVGMFNYLNNNGDIEYDYVEYNRLRSKLLDTGLGDFNDKTKDAVAAAGWTPAEFKVIRNWWLHDRDLLDKNKINIFLENNVNNKFISLVSVDSGLDHAKEYGRIFLSIAIIFILTLICHGRRPLRLLILPAALFLVCSLVVFMLMCFRFPMRVAFPAFYALILFLPVYSGDATVDVPNNNYARLLPFILLVVASLLMIKDGFSAIDGESVVNRIATQNYFSAEARAVADTNGNDSIFVNLNPLISNLVSSYRPFDEDNREFGLKTLPGGAFSHTKWYNDYINKEFDGCGKNVVPCLINNGRVVFYFYDTKYLQYDVFVKKVFVEYLNRRYESLRRGSYIYLNTLADKRFDVDANKAGFIFFKVAIR